MFKEFLLKKLIQTKLGNIPKEDQERILRIVTKNPQLFQEIATKIKHQMDSGKSQEAATISVMSEYQEEIKKLMAEESNYRHVSNGVGSKMILRSFTIDLPSLQKWCSIGVTPSTVPVFS